MAFSIYLAGEIHTDWRDQIQTACAAAGLDLEITSPVTDHPASDRAAQNVLGENDDPFWRDLNSARINAIRTHTLIRDADAVVVRFGAQYKQWNAAFDAGFASALGIPVITLHAEELTHALKEVNAGAYASARTPEQVAQILAYCFADSSK
jgi:YtoQ family protein